MKKLIILLAALMVLAACQPQTVEVTRVVTEEKEVEVTRVVTETVVEQGEEVEVTRVVTETVVEEVVVEVPAEEVVEPLDAAPVLGELPRNETMIVDILTGRVTVACKIWPMNRCGPLISPPARSSTAWRPAIRSTMKISRS